MAEDLSAMMNGLAIYDKQRFAEMPMPAKLRKRIGQALQANALVDANRLALEAVLDKDIAQRPIKKRVQKWINLKGGLRRLEGETVIHARAKIKGKEHNATFKTVDEAEARGLKAAWVAELQRSIEEACAVKESLASFVESYLRSRSVEVVRKEIKPGTITALRRTYNDIGQHWFGFRTLSLCRIIAKSDGWHR